MCSNPLAAILKYHTPYGLRNTLCVNIPKVLSLALQDAQDVQERHDAKDAQARQKLKNFFIALICGASPLCEKFPGGLTPSRIGD